MIRLILLTSLLIVFIQFPSYASGGDTDGTGNGASLEVEINTGPEFNENDKNTIKACTEEFYWGFFPMDFLFNGGNLQSNSNECPNISFFSFEYDFCWVLELYQQISPAITLSILIYAIIHL